MIDMNYLSAIAFWPRVSAEQVHTPPPEIAKSHEELDIVTGRCRLVEAGKAAQSGNGSYKQV